MRTIVLGLQGGRANGSESTFDNQPMQPGIHLRWSFSPELGFPPGAFWLYRRVVQPTDSTIAPPQDTQTATPPEAFPSQGPASLPPGSSTCRSSVSIDPCCAHLRVDIDPPCNSLRIAGQVTEACTCLLFWTYRFDDDGAFRLTGFHELVTRDTWFRCRLEGCAMACVLIEGALRIDTADGMVASTDDAGVSGACGDASGR